MPFRIIHSATRVLSWSSPPLQERLIPRWTLTVEWNPDEPGQSSNLVAVKGWLVGQNITLIPWLPQGDK